MRILMVLLLVLLAVAAGLGCGSDCSGEKDEVRRKYGEPESWYSFEQGCCYRHEDWWYWRKGVSYSFTWGDGICDVSKFRFSPIRKPVSKVARQQVEDTKQLVSYAVHSGGSCPVCPDEEQEVSDEQKEVIE